MTARVGEVSDAEGREEWRKGKEQKEMEENKKKRLEA